MVSSANDLIRKIDFFESLDEKLVNNIARLCTELGYSSGDHIVRQGDSGLGLFFIIRGGIKVELEKSGVRTVVATMQPGDFFGELSLIDNKPRSANVICVEDTRCPTALVGCPMTDDVATPGSHVLQTEIHDVKIVIFPASQDQMLRIAAFDDGAFSATIFQPHPDGSSVHSFESSLRRDQTLFLHVPRAAEPWLENS